MVVWKFKLIEVSLSDAKIIANLTATRELEIVEKNQLITLAREQQKGATKRHIVKEVALSKRRKDLQ